MYEKLLEKNLEHIKNRKSFRSYDEQLETLVSALNSKKIATVSGLRHTGKTKLIHTLLKKTQSFEKCFYYNSELDSLGTIQTQKDLIIIFDIFVRIYGVPNIIVLQNTNNIEWIKDFISKLYKTKKYKLVIVWNNIKIEGVDDISLFPLGMLENMEKSVYGWIPEVRIIPDEAYKDFLLEALKHDIISRDILEAYSIKNIPLFYRVMSYISSETQYLSLREMHRNLKDHNIDISLLTMIDYVNAALNTKFLSRCYRYDVKNDNIISSKAQYFFWDAGIRKSFVLEEIDLRENLLYIELESRWYEVFWGINGRFTFEFFAKKNGKTLYIALENSDDKNEIRKTARKLWKIWNTGKKFLIVQNKDSLWMRKFKEDGVQIIEIQELLTEI